MKILKKLLKLCIQFLKLETGEDFAYIGSYLLSENNKWITGQIFHIDGGRSTLRIKS